jgi:hypothetical protein
MVVASSTTEAQMPKLSDTALIILSSAAKRDSGSVLPLSKSLKGGMRAAEPNFVKPPAD